MALPADLDHDKLADAGLALLALTMFDDHGATRAWKGLDWDLLDVLYQKGWILNPRGKAKSVILTDEGARLARERLRHHFSAPV
jgi:hypothetical protein